MGETKPSSPAQAAPPPPPASPSALKSEKKPVASPPKPTPADPSLVKTDKLLNEEAKIRTVRLSEPQVFLVVRRRKLTHYMQFGESCTFLDVKREIERCTQVAPEHQALYYNMNGELMNDTLTLYQSGFPGLRHLPTDPAVFYVSFRQADGKFESVEITDYLQPAIEGPHVIDGPGGSQATFPIADYAQKLLQQMSIKHDVRK